MSTASVEAKGISTASVETKEMPTASVATKGCQLKVLPPNPLGEESLRKTRRLQPRVSRSVRTKKGTQFS